MKKQKETIEFVLGARLRQLRKRARWTQEQLGAQVKVSHQQIHKYEHGTSEMTVGMFMSICKALDCDPGVITNELARVS